MKRSELIELKELVGEWIKETGSDIEKLRETNIPIRFTGLSRAINAKQECAEELLNLLEKMEVEG